MNSNLQPHLVVEQSLDGVTILPLTPAHSALVLAFVAAQLAVAADRHALAIHANPRHVVVQVARRSIYHLWWASNAMGGLVIKLFFNTIKLLKCRN